MTDQLKDLLNLPEENKEDVGKFFEMVTKVLTNDCANMDCGDILSNCCGVVLSTVFATLPLQVICSKCGKVYLLRDVIKK
jgi:hypothetical protein